MTECECQFDCVFCSKCGKCKECQCCVDCTCSDCNRECECEYFEEEK
jgi:hypothetical protein